MPISAPPSSRVTGSPHSSVRLARASLFKFVGLLAAVILCASALLVYLAQNLDRTEQAERLFYMNKALHALEKSAATTVKDYAFWGDAYKHLHSQVSTDWAFVRQNLGTTLYSDFGYEGVFVVDARDRTVYSVVAGELSAEQASTWLGPALGTILEQARAGATDEVPVTTFVRVAGVPALIGAAALTPGTDPTVQIDDGPASVLLFVAKLDSKKVTALGEDFGIEGLRLAATGSAGDGEQAAFIGLGPDAATGGLQWTPPRPGQRMLLLVLPLIGLAVLLVGVMTQRILRRATLDAQVIDSSFDSLQASQAALATSEARFRDVVEASSDWIWEIDAEYRFSYLSERFEQVTGLSRAAWIGAAIDDLLGTEAGPLSHWIRVPNRRPGLSVQCSYIDSQGRARITRLSARAMAGAGFRGAATDITEEVEARRRIEFLSQHDALTGLPNRTRLQEFLDGKLKAVPTDEHPLVMLSLDLDRFKPVNDLLGHAAGDRVLNEISRRLADCVRHGDLVARVGGDEFVLILSDISSQQEIEALCARLIESIEQQIELEGQEVFVSASIGIAMAPTDAVQAAELLRYADIALYEAKAAGRSTWRFYAGEMNARIIERRRLENDLRYAIKNGELRLHFQPRFRLVDGRMVGAEALVRWQHPELGLIQPDTFIPIAEESGLILPLSNWVLDTACQCARDWPSDLFVSINISSSEFQRGNLVKRVQQAIADSAIDPSRVELEVTENVVLEDTVAALDIMHKLKRLGVRIAMDDFGTGYSSLSYLRSFPFDGLKIDRSFLSQINENLGDHSIIQAIVGLGRALSLTVTAEGIETAQQLELLKTFSCDEGQGFLLSRPLESASFEALLERHQYLV